MKLFAIFHCNLMFSSIPERLRPEVVRRCYRPLLALVGEHGFPLGIEATGLTLEFLAEIAPDWIADLRGLIGRGACELVGSGYSQLIGPLVPASVNRANLRLGHEAYERILGVRPRLALVNEQAWAAGLVAHYREAGYAGVFMDYDNPARYASPPWPEATARRPQRALGAAGDNIPVIWGRSMVFQKLQRLAHGELEAEAYLDYLEQQGPGWLPVYGNDSEIFDFRPGRFEAEAPLRPDGEWAAVARAFSALRERGHVFRLPGRALDDLTAGDPGRLLSLGSAEQPIPVKKQRKYNVTRWAVTGRDDFRLNSLCRAVAARLEECAGEPTVENDALWRELCFCWSSDLRTHITPERFDEAARRLDALAGRAGAVVRQPAVVCAGEPVAVQGRLLTVRAPGVRAVLNLAKGLAVHEAAFADHDFDPAFGTLEHGFFRDIHLGADFFSGHLVMEGPGAPKATDLAAITPLLRETESYIEVCCSLALAGGRLDKAVRLHKNAQRLDVLYGLRLAAPPPGYLRLGHVTLLTAPLDPESLFYAAANGGQREYFSLAGKDFDHGDHVSFLVSCQQAVGMTDSRVLLGGRRLADGQERVVAIEPLCAEHAFVALATCRQATPAPFVRIAFSSHELDETREYATCPAAGFAFSTGFSMTPHTTTGQ